MILGGSKVQVVENMRRAAADGDFNRKVEVDDPNLTKEEELKLVQKNLGERKSMLYFFKNQICLFLVDVIGMWLNRTTQYEGLENLKGITGGAIITSNHFNPVENTAVRCALRKVRKTRMHIVSQAGNLAMTGFVGFFMNYADIIPLCDDTEYMTRQFPALIKRAFEKKHWILIYPEQEMWLNYRKPRPVRRGAYYYAEKSQVPVISCFVEIREEEEKETAEFYKTRYVVHILPPIYPPEGVSARESSTKMMEQDYAQKTQAYESAYGKKLTYEFSDWDVAGWIPPVK